MLPLLCSGKVAQFGRYKAHFEVTGPITFIMGIKSPVTLAARSTGEKPKSDDLRENSKMLDITKIYYKNYHE